jgi:hypothetical protein
MLLLTLVAVDPHWRFGSKPSFRIPKLLKRHFKARLITTSGGTPQGKTRNRTVQVASALLSIGRSRLSSPGGNERADEGSE